MPTMKDLPDPPPQKITLRHVLVRDPGYVLVEHDGRKVEEIDSITNDDFEDLYDQVLRLGYRPLDDWSSDMALTVQNFERVRQ